MQRLIKFRVLDANDQMVFSDKDYDDDLGMFFGQMSPDGEDVMQYTGLKDKNGVEMYEGDIVKTTVGNHYWEYQISVIPNARTSTLYAVETFHNCTTDENDEFYTYKRSDSRAGSRKELEFISSSVEVIGNIYENPELLNGNK